MPTNMTDLGILRMKSYLRNLASRDYGLGIVAAILIVAGASSMPSHAAATVPSGDCSALLKLSLEGAADTPAKVTGAVAVPASSASTKDWQNYVDDSHELAAPLKAERHIPGHCRVSAYVSPAVRFELRLPSPESWNGKFMFGACSGWCGQLNEGYCVSGLVRGYASATSDGGHVGLAKFDGVWAYNNRQAEIDFSYRANHVAAQAAKAIVRAYYGREISYSYLAGCSKGGHAGLMAAQRYPADFDGIIANGPVLDYQGANALRFPWIVRAVTDSADKPILDAAKAPLIQQAVMQHCDGLDGRRDGVIEDPRRCNFDPQTLLCPAGRPGAACLSEAEVGALRLMYTPPHDSSGRTVYPAGTIPGSEGSWPGWLLPVGGDVRTRAYVGAEQYLKFLGFDPDPGPGYDFRQFDYDRDVERLRTMSPILDAVNPDLSAFAARGGKLIMMHGWADAAVSPLMTVKYYDELARHAGGLPTAQKFARLFMMPGAYHCSGGVAPNTADALTALEAWREQGIAPKQLTAIQDDDQDGVVENTRTIYPYPATSGH